MVVNDFHYHFQLVENVLNNLPSIHLSPQSVKKTHPDINCDTLQFHIHTISWDMMYRRVSAL